MLTSNLSYISVSRHVIFQNVSKVVLVPMTYDYACDLNPSLNSHVADKELDVKTYIPAPPSPILLKIVACMQEN
jgi:hypothetical protein